jgi:predicted PurR-regulated permease PerM
VRWGVRAWAGVGMVLVAYLLVRLIGVVSVVLTPLLVAGIVVFLLNPIVSLLHRHGVPRLLGTTLAYLVVLGGIVGGGLWLAVPPLVEQVRSAVDALPTDLAGVESQAEELARDFGLRVDVDGAAVQSWIVDNRETLLGSLTGVGAATADLLVVLALSLLGLVAAFYLLVDLPRLRRVAVAVVPPDRREEAGTLGMELAGTVGGFLRGQLLVATFVGVATTIAMLLLGLPLWLFVGLVAGITNLVPFVGPFVGGLLAIGIALANGEPLLALWVLLAIVAIQQVESSIVAPLVVGRTVELHPLVVLLAVLVGGSIAGILGLLVAVPLAASARVLFRHVWVARSPYSGDLFPVESEHAQSPPDRAATDS